MLTIKINIAIGIALLAATTLARPAFAGADTDGDGVPDTSDNCSQVANPDQRDTNNDGFGNICDPDLNNDNTVNFVDLNAMRPVFFTADPDANFDGIGIVNFADLAIMSAYFFGPPGPGAVAAPVSYAADMQPILEEKCDSCHTDDGFGGHNIGNEYNSAFNNANTCPGQNIAECSLTRIQNGTMPLSQSFQQVCSGDPAADVGIPDCLTQDEQDLFQQWLDDGLLP